MSKTLRPLAGLVAASALLLSSCGSAGIHPGVAVRVGDDTVSLNEVDRLAKDYCAAIEQQLTDNKQVVPHSYLRGGIAGQVAVVSAARQLAAEYDVEPGVQYDQKVAQLEGSVATMPEDQQRAVIEIESGSAYLTGVLQAVGEKVLRDHGTAHPDSETASAEGQKELTAWLKSHDVSIDPQFGIEIKDGRPVPTDTGVSYGVGATAKQGAAETPDQAYAAALPDAHRCG